MIKIKLYVFTVKKLIAYVSAILGVICLTIINYNNARTVFRTNLANELPIYCVDTDKKVCALTFDAAWGAEDTDKLIEILGKYNVKATFFVVGDWVDKFPDEVKKLSDAGHDIMNHSNTHPYMTKLDNNTMINEVRECTQKIESITNKKVNLFRAPYGDYNSNVIKKLKDQGYFTIQWDVDSLDWKDLSSDEIIERVTSRTKNGSIILFHNAAKHTPEALPHIIEKLKNNGFEMKKINDIILKNNYYIDNTGKQFKNRN